MFKESNMIVEIFVVPLCDEGCDCGSEENFEEEVKAELDPCSAGTCDCVQESKVSPFAETTPVDAKAFNELFNKYTEANNLVLSLQNEILKLKDSAAIRGSIQSKYVNEVERLNGVNKELRSKNISLTRQRDEVYNALKAFEKRIATLPA